MILDTCFIIDVMDGDEAAIKKVKEMENKFMPQIITSPTIFELYSGLEVCVKKEAERKKIIDTLSNITLLNFDIEAAEQAGHIDGKLVKSGNMIGPIDSMIAGIAISRNEKLLTRNLKHFSRITELKTEAY